MPLSRNVSAYRTEEQETKGFPSSIPATLQIFWPCRDNKCGWVDPVVWCGLTGTQTWPEFGRFLTNSWALPSPFPCQLPLRIKKGPSGHPGQHFGSGNAPRAVTCCKSWLTVINSSTQLALGSFLHLGEAILHLSHLQSFGGFGDMNHTCQGPHSSHSASSQKSCWGLAGLGGSDMEVLLLLKALSWFTKSTASNLSIKTSQRWPGKSPLWNWELELLHGWFTHEHKAMTVRGALGRDAQ